MTLKTINVYKKCTAKPYSLLVIDTTIASDNPSRFRKNLSKLIQKLIRKFDDKIGNVKLLYDIARELENFIKCCWWF